MWRVESARTWCLDGITGVGGAATAKPNVGKTLNGWEKDKPELSLVAGRGEGGNFKREKGQLMLNVFCTQPP